ncbi:MAG: YidC/Oxa1 family membrane protein insertase [Phascolarctobacterium sp.]|nr:YidC/Oxa1 family membrane protein insertase [Phascolarctobacterium sp.]
MEFLSIMYQLIFMPLQIIFEVIYYLAFRLIGNPGISIIALSFIVNLLVLPLYNRADAIQEAERDIEVKLSKGVEHIKKTFKGDEQLMILQTYYRQNGYSPLDSIKGSISLFLEIPFFVAAYQFLSHLEILNGAILGPIKDLGVPDGLLSIAGMTINVLPFIMTAVNLVSAYIFTKNLTRKTKMQLYGMACFFLVFLYASPAGLVFYWTLNNIFNLVKTIICKLDNVDKGVNIVFGVLGAFIILYGCVLAPEPNLRKAFYSTVLGLLLNSRLICKLIRSKFPRKVKAITEEPNRNLYFAGAFFLALLIGALIPSAVIGSAPKEFVIVNYFNNPLWYVASSSAIAFGTFVLWGGVFYWLAADDNKVSIERIVWFASGAAIVDYMFFNNSFGVLSMMLHYEKRVGFSNSQKIINLVAIIAVILVLNFIWKKYKKNVFEVLSIGIIAVLGMTTFNIFGVQAALNDGGEVQATVQGTKGHLSLSKNGKNVVVVMLDRAMGEYVPYIFNEKPELKEKFSGFTYYNNVISHGGHTIFGAPSIFGGYEYTPVEMNKRDKDSLIQKHREASNLMPELFGKEGFNVVTGAAYTEDTVITDQESATEIVAMNNRNFYFYGIFKSAPVIMQKFLYDNGDYLSGKVLNQSLTSLHTAFGVNKNFMREYKVLDTLPEMSHIKEQGNNFLSFANNVPHAPCLLQMPDYVPASRVNNTSFVNEDWYVVNGRKLKMTTRDHVSHYHANMAAFLKLAEWFDFMKDNGVYDNTRIILVSDHGAPLYHFDELVLDDGKGEPQNIEWYYPLLLVKDFDSQGFKETDEFMTNADVVTIATQGIIHNPVNPFTGKEISNKAKYEDAQYVFASHAHSLSKHDKNTYIPGDWYSVHTDIWNKENWKVAKKDAVLPY